MGVLRAIRQQIGCQAFHHGESASDRVLLDYDWDALHREQRIPSRFAGLKRGKGSVAMRLLRRPVLALGLSVALVSMSVSLSGQGGPRPSEPARPWPPARTADGQPDVQGNWRPILGGTHSLDPAQSSAADFEARVSGVSKRNPSRIVDPPDGHIPVPAVGGCPAETPGGRIREPDETRAHRHADAVPGAGRAAALLLSDVPHYSAAGQRCVRLG